MNPIFPFLVKARTRFLRSWKKPKPDFCLQGKAQTKFFKARDGFLKRG